MRRRLVLAFVTVALLGTLLIAIPRAFYLTDGVTDRGQVVSTLLALALSCLSSLALSSAAGWWVSGRLSAPFVQLVPPARALGEGRFDVDIPHSDVPEAEAIGQALRDSAHRLDALVRKDREVAASASHVLRTPVTALRLDLEDLALWPQTHPEVGAQLQHCLVQLDRLARDITSIIDASSSQDVTQLRTVDLSELVREAVQRSRAGAPTRGRTVRQLGGPVTAGVEPAAVGELLDRLLRAALSRTGDRGEVRVEATHEGTHLEVRLASGWPDTDPAPSPAEAVDLEPLRVLVASLGGHLRTPTGPRPALVVLLPDRRSMVGAAATLSEDAHIRTKN